MATVSAGFQTMPVALLRDGLRPFLMVMGHFFDFCDRVQEESTHKKWGFQAGFTGFAIAGQWHRAGGTAAISGLSTSMECTAAGSVRAMATGTISLTITHQKRTAMMLLNLRHGRSTWE